MATVPVFHHLNSCIAFSHRCDYCDHYNHRFLTITMKMSIYILSNEAQMLHINKMFWLNNYLLQTRWDVLMNHWTVVLNALLVLRNVELFFFLKRVKAIEENSKSQTACKPFSISSVWVNSCLVVCSLHCSQNGQNQNNVPPFYDCVFNFATGCFPEPGFILKMVPCNAV